MRHKIVVASSLLALVLLFGGTVAFAQGPARPPKMGLSPQIAEKLNLSADDVADIKSQLDAGKSFKEVLADHGVTLDQIREALGTLGHHDKRHRLSNTQIANLADQLGLDADEIEQALADGKHLPEILREHNITPEQLHEVFGELRPDHPGKPRKG